MKSINERKSEFYAQHIEALEQQMWLMGIDLFIFDEAINSDGVMKNVKEVKELTDKRNNLEVQIASVEARKQMVMKLMHKQ